MSTEQRRSSALDASGDAPTFLLSPHGLVLRTGVGPTNLPEMALRSVALAEQIGAQLALAAFSLMEVRLEGRQFVFARRADRNVEAVQLTRLRSTDAFDTARPQTGEIVGEGPLASVRHVAGVQSCFIVSAAGELAAGDLAPPLDDISIATLSPLLLGVADALPHAKDHLLCTLHYGGHLLFLRALHQGMLCVLASAWVNQTALRSGIGVTARQWSLLTSGVLGSEGPVSTLRPPAAPSLTLRNKHLVLAAVGMIAAGVVVALLVPKPGGAPGPLPPPPAVDIEAQPAPAFQPPPPLEIVHPRPTIEAAPSVIWTAPAHRTRRVPAARPPRPPAAASPRPPAPAPRPAAPAPRPAAPAPEAPRPGDHTRGIDDSNPYLRDVP